MSITSLLLLILLTTGFIYLFFDKEEDAEIRERINNLAKNKKSETTTSKLIKNMTEMVKPFSHMFFKNDEQKESLKNQLIQAGKDFSEEAILRFSITRVVLALICLPFAIYLALKGDLLLAFLAFLLPLAFYIFPKIVLGNIISKRQAEIRRFLPDTLELLTVCVEAGLGLDASLARVSKEYRRTSPVISQEFERVNRDVLAGISRDNAFRGLVKRNNVEELKSFAALLVQADKMGTSISKALRVYCDTIRTKKRQRIEEITQQASTKMVVPMVGCLLPALFVIILSPAVMTFMSSMK